MRENTDETRTQHLLEKGFFNLSDDEISELATIYVRRVSWLHECEAIALTMETATFESILKTTAGQSNAV